MSSRTWQLFEEAMQQLVPRGKVAVGVSGGADSMALLHLLCAWNGAARDKLILTAVTVDHGLREESAVEAATVASWARDLGVDHQTIVWEGEKPSGNIEAVARAARYDLMGKWCLENDVLTLMTAHHFDDQAETFLMRLARGSGVAGLSAMAQKRPLGADFPGVELVRPLLRIPKENLVALLQEVQQPWFEDPSNEDDDFTRSRLRTMRETFDSLGLTADRLVATADRMSDADLVLEGVACELWREACQVSSFGEVRLDVKTLMAARADTRRRVLARALKGVSGATFAPRYERLLRLEEAIASGKVGNGVTLHGCKVSQVGERLCVVREAGREAAEALIAGHPGLWDGRFRIEWAKIEERVEIRALGAAGLKALKQLDWVAPADLPPRDVLLSVPAAWRGDALLAAPLLGYESGLFKARFMLFE